MYECVCRERASEQCETGRQRGKELEESHVQKGRWEDTPNLKLFPVASSVLSACAIRVTSTDPLQTVHSSRLLYPLKQTFLEIMPR